MNFWNVHNSISFFTGYYYASIHGISVFWESQLISLSDKVIIWSFLLQTLLDDKLIRTELKCKENFVDSVEIDTPSSTEQKIENNR
jgi:hypothetical protein